jgi:hypothetical protein
MVFDNKKTTIRIYLRKMITAIVAVVLLMIILVSGWFENSVLGIPRYQWVILVALIYLVQAVISGFRKMNFFYFSDEGDRILLRYHPIHPLVQRKNAVQIPKTGLAGYEIRNTLLGLRRVIILRQHVRGKLATYPPISITSLNSREISLLTTSLDRVARP